MPLVADSAVVTEPNTLPGGHYVAEEQSDGTWTIRDIPFFAELPAGIRSNSEDIGKDWLDAVVSHHEYRENAEKYLAPVHLNHHDTGRDTPRVGFLRPLGVKQILLDGKRKWTIFADIVGVQEHWVDIIKNYGAPFVSAEIPPDWRTEMLSLAISEDEPPHFKMPLMNVGEMRRFKPEFGPVVAFSATEESMRLVFNFKGTTMPATKRTADKPADKPADKDKKDILDDDDEKKKKKKDNDDIEKKVFAAMKKFADEKDDKDKKDREPVIEPVEAALLSAVRAGIMPEIAKLSGEVSGLKESISARDKAEKLASSSTGAAEKLRAEGWHVSDDLENRIARFAALGEEALKDFIDSHKRFAPKEPPKDFESFAASGDDDKDGDVFESDDKHLEKYAVKGPQFLERARRWSREYAQLQAGGLNLKSSAEEFIDTNMAHEQKRAEIMRAG